jgi:hypothetical protein
MKSHPFLHLYTLNEEGRPQVAPLQPLWDQVFSTEVSLWINDKKWKMENDKSADLRTFAIFHLSFCPE